MKVRVKRAFANYRAGDVIEPAGAYRDELMSRDLIEYIKEPAVQSIETAAFSKPVETATIRRSRRHNQQEIT